MTVSPYQPRPAVVPGGLEHALLRRVLGVAVRERFVARMILIDRDVLYVALVDSGYGSVMTPSDRDTALHVLWARDESTASIAVGGCGEMAVAPGDSLTLAAGTGWAYGPGLLVCEIGGPRSAPRPGRVVGPTHGLERFEGYNRQTLCAVAPGFALERWKVTQPLALPGDAAIVNLIDPMALLWPGGTDLVGRGEMRILPPALARVTLLPDGLGYALVIRPHPDTVSLVQAFGREAIATVTL